MLSSQHQQHKLSFAWLEVDERMKMYLGKECIDSGQYTTELSLQENAQLP